MSQSQGPQNDNSGGSGSANNNDPNAAFDAKSSQWKQLMTRSARTYDALSQMVSGKSKRKAPDVQAFASKSVKEPTAKAKMSPLHVAMFASGVMIIGAIVIGFSWSERSAAAQAQFFGGLESAVGRNYDLALTRFNAAEESGFDKEELYLCLGAVYAKRGDADKAIAEYSKALTIDGGDSLALTGRASQYFVKRNYKKSLADCDAVLAKDARSVDALKIRADGRALTSDYTQALTDCQQAAQIAKGPDADLLATQAYVHAKMGSLQKAIDELDAAMKLKPNDLRLGAERAAYLQKQSDKTTETVDKKDTPVAPGSGGATKVEQSSMAGGNIDVAKLVLNASAVSIYDGIEYKETKRKDKRRKGLSIKTVKSTQSPLILDKETEAELIATIAKEPGNMYLRTRLARHYFETHDLAKCRKACDEGLAQAKTEREKLHFAPLLKQMQ